MVMPWEINVMMIGSAISTDQALSETDHTFAKLQTTACEHRSFLG